jgi:hypothetical protein
VSKVFVEVTVRIPGRKYCTGCPFFQTIVKNWGMEESFNRCAYLNQDINESVPLNVELGKAQIKKLPNCPTFQGEKNAAAH